MVGTSIHVGNIDTIPKTWADRAATPAISAPSQPTFSLKTGSGRLSDKVKSVPRYLTCFVGRLEKDTTEEDLCSYLEEVGIKEVRCRKLSDNDGRFRTAAFRVSCGDSYKDLFYKESSWPEGVELRDWIFRRRDG